MSSEDWLLYIDDKKLGVGDSFFLCRFALDHSNTPYYNRY